MIAIENRGGIHLPALDLWLDPPGPRGFAFVSHAHSDHTGRHRETVLSEGTSRLMRARIGASPREHVLAFGETREFRGTRFTLLPAGHVRGSAQLHLENADGSLLYTGDFKLRPGLSSEPAEWRTAETLVMETTFGRPEFVFPPTQEVLASVVRFCREALEDGEVPVLLGYSLGKAQEILWAVAAAGLRPMLHGAVAKMTRVYAGLVPEMPPFEEYNAATVDGCVLICPPGLRNSRMITRLRRRRVAMLSGWAMTSGAVHRYQCDAAFPLSDHAGYDDLLRYVELVRPRRVLTLHGYASEFARDLRERGLDAWSLVSPDQLEFPGFNSVRGVARMSMAAAGLPDSPFGRFCRTAEAVAEATGRSAKTRVLAEFLRTLEVGDVRRAALWLSGTPFEPVGGRSVRTGWVVLRRAIGAAAGKGEDEVRAVSRRCNDAGLATRELMAACAGGAKHSLQAVEEMFLGLSAARSPAVRQSLLEGFFRGVTPREAACVVGILTGDLRIGLKEGLMEEAIGLAFRADPVELREAGMLLGDAGALAVAAHRGELASAGLQVFRPIKCMLAAAEPDGEAVWRRLSAGHGAVWSEDKFDGIRAQVHVSDGRCEIFSRDLRCMTQEFPEIAAGAATLPGGAVLDGEIMAAEGGTFFDLQKRLNRKEADLFVRGDIPVVFVAFDILWRDGATLIRSPWLTRRAVLEGLPLKEPLRRATVARLESAAAVEEEFRAARARGNEGLVVKDPDSAYSPGRRGLAWIKLKKHFATLDVVVTGVEYGHGRRREVLSDYTFAVRDDESGGLLVIGKAYSGLTDLEIADLTPHFLSRVRRVRGRLHEVEPDVVLEVAFDAIRESTRHASGLALRFPRIKRLRRDKTAEDIDTLRTARSLAAL